MMTCCTMPAHHCTGRTTIPFTAGCFTQLSTAALFQWRRFIRPFCRDQYAKKTRLGLAEARSRITANLSGDKFEDLAAMIDEIQFVLLVLSERGDLPMRLEERGLSRDGAAVIAKGEDVSSAIIAIDIGAA